MADIKSFVIRLLDNEVSEGLAKECINSGKGFGLRIIPFNGIYGEENIEKKHRDLRISPWKSKMKKGRLGVKGCFISHYSLWLECIRVHQPIIIFEHDAVLLRPIPVNILSQFDEFLMLDPYNKMRPEYKDLHSIESKERIEEYFNNDATPKYGVMEQYAMGLQAYIIKPKAALKLIKHVSQKGYLPADIQCNKGLLNMQTIYPSVASVNPRYYGGKKLMKEESTTQKKW